MHRKQPQLETGSFSQDIIMKGLTIGHEMGHRDHQEALISHTHHKDDSLDHTALKRDGVVQGQEVHRNMDVTIEDLQISRK